MELHQTDLQRSTLELQNPVQMVYPSGNQMMRSPWTQAHHTSNCLLLLYLDMHDLLGQGLDWFIDSSCAEYGLCNCINEKREV